MKLICLIFIFFIFYTQLKETRQQIFLQRNDGGLKLGNFRHLHRHRLNVSPQETLELDKEIQCVSKCVQKPDCFSLNTKKTTDDKFLCEFLNTSRYKNHDNLTKDDNYVHWYFGDSCLPQPCIHGKCWVTDSTQTGFTCDCHAWSSGKRCEFYNSNYNFALGKQTVQSSTYSNSLGPYASSLAVDGVRVNIASYNNKPCCTITNIDSPAWWRVDLQHEIPVVRVTITNRQDYQWEGLENCVIKIGNSLVNEGMENPKCGEEHSIGRGLTETITCSPPLSGRYLLVEAVAVQYMQICELEVYTDPSLIGE